MSSKFWPFLYLDVTCVQFCRLHTSQYYSWLLELTVESGYIRITFRWTVIVSRALFYRLTTLPVSHYVALNVGMINE